MENKTLNNTDAFFNDSADNAPRGPDGKSEMEMAMKWSMTVAVIIILIGMGSTLTWQDILPHFQRPFGILAGMLSQFILLPAVAFGLAHAFKYEMELAIGLLLISSTPGGTFSNIFSYWCDGDLALSICMTTVSTIVAIGMMPLNLYIYGRSWSEKQISLPYLSIGISLICFVIPVLVGMAFRRFSKRLTKISLMLANVITLPALVTVIVLQILISKETFNQHWTTFFGAVLLPVLRLAFGFVMGIVFRLSYNQCRTVGLETGCQNVPLALTTEHEGVCQTEEEVKMKLPPENSMDEQDINADTKLSVN